MSKRHKKFRTKKPRATNAEQQRREDQRTKDLFISSLTLAVVRAGIEALNKSEAYQEARMALAEKSGANQIAITLKFGFSLDQVVLPTHVINGKVADGVFTTDDEKDLRDKFGMRLNDN